ncbi:MAG: gamma carbonic anhydrase family protein, partial [Ktedonobacteraceae bacterium]
MGDVTLGEGSSVWFGASLRTETVPIKIGARTNIQDNSSLHTDAEFPISIGEDVSIGHGAIIHGAVIGSNCLIGMGCILLNGCKIGNNCMLGAASLVLQGGEFPDDMLILGSPAKARRPLTQ